MNVSHEFGGSWTEEKLSRVRGYLQAYSNIFDSNENARWYDTVYVDAFAGTGHRCDKPSPNLQADCFAEELLEPQATAFREGSATIALTVNPGFKRYLFIERSPERVKELERLKAGHPKESRIAIRQGDANDQISKWVSETDWNKTRAVVFLDPYGMQVSWSTIAQLGATKGVDLWLLFPLGMAVMRLLTRRQPPPPEWEKALTRIFGDSSWKDRFYVPSKQGSLFAEEEFERNADWKSVAAYTVERLKTVFSEVHDDPYPLFNSGSIPLYLLCFAAGNPKGARTALKIAGHLLAH